MKKANNDILGTVEMNLNLDELEVRSFRTDGNAIYFKGTDKVVDWTSNLYARDEGTGDKCTNSVDTWKRPRFTFKGKQYKLAYLAFTESERSSDKAKKKACAGRGVPRSGTVSSASAKVDVAKLDKLKADLLELIPEGKERDVLINDLKALYPEDRNVAQAKRLLGKMTPEQIAATLAGLQ